VSTAKWKNEHREFASRILDTYRTMEGFKHLTLHNDEEDYDLGTFTREGVALLQYIIAQHRCGVGCKPTCAVIHLAWVIEGCPNGHESVEEALERNTITIIPKEAKP